MIKEVFIRALNKLVTDKKPALEMMEHIKARIDDTSSLEEKPGKVGKAFDEKVILLQVYISKNAITEKELSGGRYAELEKEYWEALAEKERLQDELTELISRLGLTDESYDSRSIKGIPDKDNPLDRVNDLCDLLQRFLSSHAGFMREDLQDYLNLFSIMVNPPENKYEKVKKILELGLEKTILIRFKEKNLV